MTKQQTEPQEERQEEDQTPEPTIWDRLAEPFPPKELEWKIQRSGKTQGGKYWAQIVPYVQSRAIMQRLDSVVGPANWQDEYVSSPCGQGYMCLLSIRNPDREDEWIVKADGADRTKFEGTKGGFSNSLKRAAVKFGMGRHLYDMQAVWADIGPDQLSREQKDSGIWQRGSVTVKDESGKERKEWFNWSVPESQLTGKTTQDVKRERLEELDEGRPSPTPPNGEEPKTAEQVYELAQWLGDKRIKGDVAAKVARVQRDGWKLDADVALKWLVEKYGVPQVTDEPAPKRAEDITDDDIPF